MLKFFSKAESITQRPVRGFKVSLNSDRSKKYGVAASSLEAFRKKIETKFGLKSFDLFLTDGSLIDPTDEDYFSTVPVQSLIIVAEDGEDIKTGKLENFFFTKIAF